MEQEAKKRLTRPMDMAVTIVKEYIDNHPLEWKTIDDFSVLTSINRKRLQPAFKNKYNITINDYQLMKRMEYAVEMLREGRMSHKQIASKCGYFDSHNFCRAFKKIYKCSPKDWANEYAHQLDLSDTKKD